MYKYQFVVLFVLTLLPLHAVSTQCSGGPLAVQILGSGGPVITGQRASASYLLWVDSKARLLIDMGGGAALRFAQSNAKLSDLSVVAISHLHPDHVSDLPALLWLSGFRRKTPLAIVGPAGNDEFPAFPEFLQRLFDGQRGAFQVLGSLLKSVEGGLGVPLQVSLVDHTYAEPVIVFKGDDLIISAIGIPHRDIPTLAYRVSARGHTVVFSSDQAGTDPKFVKFSLGADLLIMHMAVASGTKSALHAAPEVIGKVAEETGIKRLIVSHIGTFDLNVALADVKKVYSGDVTVAADLMCTQVSQ